MKNARNQKSRNRDGRNASASATVAARNKHTDGDRVRKDDENKRSDSGGDTSGPQRAQSSNSDAQRNNAASQRIEITDGYYFTPNGDIERIPSGYFIGNDGRLRKRRQSDTGRNADARNQSGNQSGIETGEEQESSTKDFLLNEDKPLNVRGGRRRKSKEKEETIKLSLVTMIATGCTAIFTSVALLTKHDHWSLEVIEARKLAEAINEAISTLPVKYYETLTTVIEKWIPWINVIFVISAIIFPRIEESSKLIEESHYKSSDRSNEGNPAENNHHFSSKASVGWNQ